MDLSLGLWFNLIDEHVCFVPISCLLSLEFCSTAWKNRWWYPQQFLPYRIVSANLFYFVCFFHLNLSIVRSIKNCAIVLMGNALNLQIAFDKMAILNILILPINEHGEYFHLLISSSILFQILNICQKGLLFDWLVLHQDILCYKGLYPWFHYKHIYHLYIGELISSIFSFSFF